MPRQPDYRKRLRRICESNPTVSVARNTSRPTVPESTSRDMEVRYNRIYRSDTRVCQDTPTVPVEIRQFKAVHGRGL